MKTNISVYALFLITTLSFQTSGGCGGNNSNDNSLNPEFEAQLREVVTRYKKDFGVPGVLAGVWIP